MLAHVSALRKSLNLNGEGYGVALCATGKSSGKSKSYLFVGKLNFKLAIFGNSVVIVVYGPSDSNVGVVLTCERKLDNGVLGNVFGSGEKFLLSCDLLVLGLLYELEVLEAIKTHRNEVRITVVKDKDTLCVSSPTELSCVSLVDNSLVSTGVNAVVKLDVEVDEVGNVGSHIGLLAVKLEVEILAGFLFKLLTADGNALEDYGETNVVNKALACCELLGEVNGRNRLDRAVNDRNLTALDFLHAGVRLASTGNRYGHTGLNTLKCGVINYGVAVVTALALCVSNEYVVVLVVVLLSVDSNYDTLDGNDVALLCCHVLFEGENLVDLYVTGEGCGDGCTVTCGDGSGKSVVVCFLGLGEYVYGPGCVVVNKLNLVAVNGPIYGILDTCDHNLAKNLVVELGDDHASIVLGITNIGLGYKKLLRCGKVVGDVLVVIAVIVAKDVAKNITAGENTKAKNSNENE